MYPPFLPSRRTMRTRFTLYTALPVTFEFLQICIMLSYLSSLTSSDFIPTAADDAAAAADDDDDGDGDG